MYEFDKSILMSIPEERVIHGVTIKKVPTGKYIGSVKSIKTLPSQVIRKCFPGQSLSDIFTAFMSADDKSTDGILLKLLTVAPELVIDVVCEITGVDKNAAMNKLTPAELLDIFLAWWELNDMTRFFANAWGVMKKLAPTLLNIGSSGGSQ